MEFMNCMISICNCWRKNARTQSSEAFQTLDNIFLLEFFSNITIEFSKYWLRYLHCSDRKVQSTWCFEKLVELLGGDGDQLLVGQADVVVVGYKLADVPVLVGRGLHVHLEKYKISLFSLSAAAVFWRLQQAGLLQCVMWRRLQSSLQQVHCPLQSGRCTSTARLCSIKCNMLCRSNCFEQV